jgi:mono/diheme cytochrome c family protein
MKLFFLTLPLALLAGCDLSMSHQAKYGTETHADLWGDGSEARKPPEGAVAVDALDRDHAEQTPPPVTPALLQRGRERYAVYCTPCHGATGAGDGQIVARGFPKPPDLNLARLRVEQGQKLFDAVSQGYGAMYPFADRVGAADRWAIVAYVRALQTARDGAS